MEELREIAFNFETSSRNSSSRKQISMFFSVFTAAAACVVLALYVSPVTDALHTDLIKVI